MVSCSTLAIRGGVGRGRSRGRDLRATGHSTEARSDIVRQSACLGGGQKTDDRSDGDPGHDAEEDATDADAREEEPVADVADPGRLPGEAHGLVDAEHGPVRRVVEGLDRARPAAPRVGHRAQLERQGDPAPPVVAAHAGEAHRERVGLAWVGEDIKRLSRPQAPYAGMARFIFRKKRLL